MTKSWWFVILLLMAWIALALLPVLLQPALPLWVSGALGISGGFSLLLGLIHFFLPKLLGYGDVIGTPARAFHLGPITYALKRQDLLGIVWVMNHHASYTLVTIGLLDLLGPAWMTSAPGRLALLWIAGWWGLRSASQYYLGRRPGDWLIAAGFLILGFAHLGVWLA